MVQKFSKQDRYVINEVLSGIFWLLGFMLYILARNNAKNGSMGLAIVYSIFGLSMVISGTMLFLHREE